MGDNEGSQRCSCINRNGNDDDDGDKNEGNDVQVRGWEGITPESIKGENN